MDGIAIAALALNFLLGTFVLLYIFRIVLTWYPDAPLDTFPYTLAVWPTEPLLRLLRKAIPPWGGVDITPIVGVGVFSLLREMLLGQQGILTMMQRLP